MRIAGAPISWGVCEVPDWGYQMTPDRVLTEMVGVGITATEMGPPGFLPDDPKAKAELLAEYGLSCVGGFVAVVLHDPNYDPLPEVDRQLDGFIAAGGDVLVLAANSGQAGYDSRPVLDDAGWATMFANLDRLAAHARSRGITPCLHPHVGTMVEKRDEVLKVLESTQMPLCLDTGHLLIGGSDPVEITTNFADRIAHVHAKDVDLAMAKRVQAGELTYQEAVKTGMYVPLGRGDVDFSTIVGQLNTVGYTGWYVMEQDAILPAEPADEGPLAAVRESIGYLKGIA
jgi:inosose dehydratase